MATHIALLRGVNLGPNNRIAMPDLRERLAAEGFQNVRTYVQSGNIVLESELAPGELTDAVQALIAEHFALGIPVVVRTRDELAEIIARNPLPDAAEDPKRFQVSFLSSEPDPVVLKRLASLAEKNPKERLVATGRELYAWHPEGIGRSKLWNGVASKDGLGGIIATARNWTTVTTLLEMCDQDAP